MIRKIKVTYQALFINKLSTKIEMNYLPSIQLIMLSSFGETPDLTTRTN